MSPKTLKIALAVSVALNLFAVVAGVTTLVARDKVEDRVVAQQRPMRQRPPMMAVVEGLDPAVRDQVRQALRASALDARPDFEDARTARRAAIEMAGADTLNQAEVRALLERSRAAESRGRARLEDGAIGVLATLDGADRKALAPILSRHGGRGEGRGRRGDRAPRPAQSPVAPSAG